MPVKKGLVETVFSKLFLIPVMPDVLHIVVIFHDVDELFHQLDVLFGLNWEGNLTF